MKQTILFTLLAAFCMFSCQKAEPERSVDPNTGKILIPLSIKVSMPVTKVSGTNNGDTPATYAYGFTSGDRMHVTGAGDIDGTLDYDGSAFTGTLSCTDEPSDETTLNVVMYNAGKDAQVTDFSAAITGTVEQAIAAYSDFTGSFKWQNRTKNINLTQHTAFLEFSLTSTFTPDGSYSVALLDDNDASIVSGSVSMSDKAAHFVVALSVTGNTRTLIHPRFQFGGTTYTFGSQGDAGQNITRNNRYSITREVEADLRYIPLTFEAKEAGATVGSAVAGTGCEYSTDGSNWNTYSKDVSITLVNIGDRVYFRGASTPKTSYKDAAFACTSGQCYVFGNVMSLLSSDFAGLVEISSAEAFQSLFNASGYKANIYNHPVYDILLPATTLKANCYQQMFYGCTSITRAPDLPATTLQSACYQSMFNGCTALTSAPEELPATTLASNCCNSMFYGCSSLERAPKLMATTAQSGCYKQIFRYCSSLNYVYCNLTSLNDLSLSTVFDKWLDGGASTGEIYLHTNKITYPTGTGNHGGYNASWTLHNLDN